MQARSENLDHLPSHYAVELFVPWIVNLVHHHHWNLAIEQFLLSHLYLLAPKIDHQKFGEFLQLFLEDLVQFDSIIFKGKILHLSEFQEDYDIHVFAFSGPIDLQHRT